MLHTELLQICANFSLTFPKVRLHCPLSAPRQVGGAICNYANYSPPYSKVFSFYFLSTLCKTVSHPIQSLFGESNVSSS